jgi:thymidylate synthase (FAD)
LSNLIFTDTPPFVEVIGVSRPNMAGFEALLDYRDEDWQRDPFTDPESIAVFAGSTCYKSHDNKADRSDREYLRTSIIEHNHGSVLEHVIVNFGVASLPRSVQLETVRHRVGAAYSFMSQRFTDKFTEFIVPPLYRLPENESVRDVFMSHSLYTYNTYLEMIAATDRESTDADGTLKRKRMKEAARSILGNSIGSDGVISYNARQIRHFVSKRTDPHADQSIREFAWEMFTAANAVIPDLLQDATIHRQSWGAPQVVFEGGVA